MTDRRSTWFALLLALLPAAAGSAQDDVYGEDVAAAERALRRGEIARARSIVDEVIADWEDLRGSADAPSDGVMRRCFAATMEIALRGGSYGEVVATFEGLDAAAQRDPRLRLRFVDALLRSGAARLAEEVLRASLAEAPGDPAAGYRLGELLERTGRGAEARQVFEAVIEASRKRSIGDARQLAEVARAHLALGGRSHVEQAATLLVEAIRLDPEDPLPRTLRGLLQFEVYGEWSGADSGEKLLLEVLERNGEVEEALVGLYRIRRSNHLLDPAKTEAFLERALAANPRSVPALLERGIGLIDDRRFEEGAKVLEQALEVDPNRREVLAQRAALATLRGDEGEAAALRGRVEEISPGWSGCDLAVGDRLVALYRFADAAAHYEAALARAPEQVEVLHGLAKALVYAGQGERARALLQRARDLQPGYVNPWRNNMIAVQDLLDEEYERVEAPGFVFVLHRDDRAVLERYLLPFEAEAREQLGRKYGYVPQRPVRFEVLRSWDDFSVRTIGFRGFTALGACFGPLITMVSPVDQDLRRNDFMWTATAWHEYVHVLTLALSAHRVPRWLTEGFSVYEEGQRDRSWERGMDRELVDAYHNGEIPPVRLLNRLFRGPRILFGYYQGGLIVDLLAREHGFDKVLEMLRGYARDLSTEDVFREVLGIDSRAFDARFLAWIRDEKLARLRLRPRYGEAMVERLATRAALDADDVESQLTLAWAMLQRGNAVDAGGYLRQVLRVDPDNPDGKLAYAWLLRERGRVEEAIEAFRSGFAGGADDFDSRMTFAGLLLQRGEVDGAIEQYQAAKLCWPGCTDQGAAPELALAGIYREAGRRAEAMAELRTYCARTARAYAPRLELAAFAAENGARQEEIELLEQAVQIDPFARQVHLRLADAYEAVGRPQDMIRELEVALAVVPGIDRDHAGKPPAEVPRIDAPEFREEQAGICVRLGRALRGLGRDEAARRAFERAIVEAPGGEAADAARSLLR
jgi:tetratricopeptide (TPR) repeat protein